MFSKTKPPPSRKLVPIDDVVGNPPFIVRRDHRIVAAFAKKDPCRGVGAGALVERRKPVHGAHGGRGGRGVVRVSGRRGGAMIRQVVDKSRYNIPVSDDPRLHELTWYATEDDAVLGVVILDLVDLGYSWIALTQSDQPPGYTAANMGSSLPTEDDATTALHDAMRSIRGT